MESQDATTDFLFEWFGKYGQLERILSDKGPLFFAELVKAFLKRFGLKIYYRIALSSISNAEGGTHSSVR